METHSCESGQSVAIRGGLMSQVEQMAAFASGARFEALGADTRQQLKIRILDALGCGVGALHGEPIRMIRGYINELGSTGHCTLIGGGFTDIDRAALYNSALIRYLDFMIATWRRGKRVIPATTWEQFWRRVNTSGPQVVTS